ncbi:MAG: FecR family protein [Treponema sp.]|nr:FecR family protein [Treponema sp.]
MICIPVLFAQAPAAVIREVSGTVEVQRPGSSAWVPASPGMAIEKGTRVSTGFKSTAAVALGGAVITVRPLTRLTLEEIAGGPGAEEAEIYLQTGRIRAEVSRPSGGTINFSVRSPSVTASVRGTVFEFDTVNLSVGEGRVQYTGASGSLAFVRAGERSTVDEKNYTVTAPREETAVSFAPEPPPGSEAGGSLNGDGAAVPPGNAELTVTAEW